MQTAIDVTYDKAQGNLHLEGLNQLLQQGYTVNQCCAGYSGDILVILDAPVPPTNVE